MKKLSLICLNLIFGLACTVQNTPSHTSSALMLDISELKETPLSVFKPKIKIEYEQKIDGEIITQQQILNFTDPLYQKGFNIHVYWQNIYSMLYYVPTSYNPDYDIDNKASFYMIFYNSKGERVSMFKRSDIYVGGNNANILNEEDDTYLTLADQTLTVVGFYKLLNGENTYTYLPPLHYTSIQ